MNKYGRENEPYIIMGDIQKGRKKTGEMWDKSQHELLSHPVAFPSL